MTHSVSSPFASLAARCAVLAGTIAFASACAAQEPVDLIVGGDYVVTMEANGASVKDGGVIRDGAVAIKGGSIVAVGPRAGIAAKYRGKRSLSGANRVVMPGLINGHTHAAMTLLRGIADDIELIEWLNKYIFPTEVRFVDADFVRIGTELACAEMIRGGTTTFVDMYYFADSVARAVDACGLRALVGSTVIGQKSPDSDSIDASLRAAGEFTARWKSHARVVPMIAAHAVYTLDPEQLKRTRARAMELGIPISIHISESRFEIDYSQKNYGKTPVQHLEDIGFFAGPTIGAHVVWPTDADMAILARRKVGAIHNATSNMKISSGIAPLTKLLAAGVPLGLGTDGAATNNDQDMWDEMRLAAFLQKVATMDPKVIPARTALELATSRGADAIGLGDRIGRLAAGKRADLLQVSLEDVHFTPMYDVVSHLVYIADEQDVVTTIVEGKVLMENRKLLTVDEARVRREGAALAAKIKAALATQ